jgi:hypothetical protein
MAAAITIGVLMMACAAPGPLPGSIHIGLQREPDSSSPGGTPLAIVVTQLSLTELGGLRSATLSTEAWQRIFVVEVADRNDAHVPVAGHYEVTNTGAEFIPVFPFDRGREYRVHFDPSKMPTPRAEPVVDMIVSLPKPNTARTEVRQIYPSGDVWPANLLRIYVEFSAPMAQQRDDGGRLKIVDEAGREVVGAFPPFDSDLLDWRMWSPDFTRYTAFFDPGRVKQGILPNRQMGRPLVVGRKYTIEVGADWSDAEERPLKAAYRRDFRVGPAVTTPIAISAWKIAPPKEATRDPLAIIFPRPLDHGLLQRMLGVELANGQSVVGEIRIDAGETRWTFTPREPWNPGNHQVVVSMEMEDPSGNRIDRAFEVTEGHINHGTWTSPRYTLPFFIPR